MIFVARPKKSQVKVYFVDNISTKALNDFNCFLKHFNLEAKECESKKHFYIKPLESNLNTYIAKNRFFVIEENSYKTYSKEDFYKNFELV